MNPPENMRKIRNIGGGALKYLTYWDMVLQFVFFSLAFINDIYGTDTIIKRRQSSLQKLRDFLFSTIVFAAGTFVSISFWSLYAVDRKLIFPVEYDSWFPNWLNHGIHTGPIVGVLIEMFTICHTIPSRNTGFCTVIAFAAVYLSWVCFIAYYWDGFWVYPILAYLTMIGRAAFLTGMAILLAMIFFVGECLHAKCWGAKQAEMEELEKPLLPENKKAL